MNKNTSTKPAQKRGRKPKAQVASDFGRVCKVNFKLNGTYLSCKNLFRSLKARARNLSHSKIIAGTLEVCLNSEAYLSSRVCSIFALKVTNAAERLNFIRENINVPQENFITTKESGHKLNRENQDPVVYHNQGQFLLNSEDSSFNRAVNFADKACSAEPKITCYLLAPMAFNNCRFFSKATTFKPNSLNRNWSSITFRSGTTTKMDDETANFFATTML